MLDKNEEIRPPSDIFERRRFVRIKSRFVVSYRDVSTTQAKTDITQSKDISIGGILFTTDRSFSAGTILRITIKLPYVKTYINAKVKVVDSRQVSKNVLYETRTRFISIKKEDRDAISKMMERQL